MTSHFPPQAPQLIDAQREQSCPSNLTSPEVGSINQRTNARLSICRTRTHRPTRTSPLRELRS